MGSWPLKTSSCLSLHEKITGLVRDGLPATWPQRTKPSFVLPVTSQPHRGPEHCSTAYAPDQDPTEILRGLPTALGAPQCPSRAQTVKGLWGHKETIL